MRDKRTPLTPLAKRMRKAPTDAEARLWNRLRNRGLGLRFTRQFPIGPYIADFACRERHLIIEVDSSQHADSETDRIRDKWLSENGWSVARFWNMSVLAQTDDVLETIVAITDRRIHESVDERDFKFMPAQSPSPGPSGHPLPVNRERGDIFMAHALELARARMGRTWPNPSVGCVIVSDGEIVGEGATGDGGRPHAEEIALDKAGDAARGAVAYVTLEPCGARSTGRASCSERLVAAGVARVVYACADPSPFASHKGPQRLKDAGIAVEHGLMSEDCTILIEAWVYFLDTGLPLVIESDDPSGFDAEYTGGDLSEWAAKGYRRLYARLASPHEQSQS